MWATYRDSLKEIGGRTVLIVLVVLALIIGLMFTSRVRFGEVNGIDVVYQGPISMGPWPMAVPNVMSQLTQFSGMAWIILMIFTGCPLFVASLEKGWRELTFSKGTPRWQILLGRYLATCTLYALLVLMTDLPMALRFWVHTGIPTWPVLISIMIQTCAFAALLAVGALVSLGGENVAVPIIMPVGLVMLSQYLMGRAALYEDYITSEWLRTAIDWLYYIVPKIMELQFAAASFVQTSSLASSWPLWTTGVFTLATMTLTLWLLERKSF